MSEPIPESIPTSSDPRSHRPTKRLALTPTTQQASQLEHLFANPSKEIRLPTDASSRGLPPPPEIMPNVQGSSAGAGSGEFHVYKASRRREYERLKAMDEEVNEEKEQEKFEREREDRRRRDEEKTRKNKARREKKKGKGGKAAKGKADGQERTAAAGEKSGSLIQSSGNETPQDIQKGQTTGEQEEAGLVIHDDD